jgi:3-hydroxyacyl-CoA dehydrogenase/3a,7a,12a-trihydroxy-5b-cholest-24-enoyl-CoA hydratase
LEIHKKLSTEGKVESRFRIVDILDKGKGTVVLVQCLYNIFIVHNKILLRNCVSLLDHFIFILKFVCNFSFIYFLLDETYDISTGDKLTTHQTSIFIVGASGFVSSRNSPHVIPCIDPPKRKPCVSVTEKTSPDQVSKLIF